MQHIPHSKASSKSHDSYGGYFSPPLSQSRPSTENPQRKLHRHNFVAVPTPEGDEWQTARIITGMDSIRDGTLTGSYPATTILRRVSTLPHDQCQFGRNVSKVRKHPSRPFPLSRERRWHRLEDGECHSGTNPHEKKSENKLWVNETIIEI